MEPGFPKRSIITDRGNNLDFGGDGRYLWDIARFDKTVTVIDLSNNTTVATIPVAAIDVTACGNYVPADKCLYVHYNAGHYQINLDPSSAGFCTVLANNATLANSNSGNVVNYWQPLDAFIGVSNGFTVTPRLAPTTNYLINTGSSKATIVGLAQGLGYITKGGVNPTEMSAWFNLTNNRHITTGSFISNVCPVVNRRFFVAGSEFDENNRFIRTLNYTGGQSAYVFDFCPRSRRFIGGGGNASGWRLGVINHVNYTLVGNTPYVSSPGALAGTGYQYRNIVFSPFSGLVYARTCFHSSNVTDIHIYNATLALASMYQGHLVSGADRVPAVLPYQNCTMGLNRLKNDEYYY
jgi:hypothetical protein